MKKKYIKATTCCHAVNTMSFMISSKESMTTDDIGKLDECLAIGWFGAELENEDLIDMIDKKGGSLCSYIYTQDGNCKSSSWGYGLEEGTKVKITYTKDATGKTIFTAVVVEDCKVNSTTGYK